MLCKFNRQWDTSSILDFYKYCYWGSYGAHSIILSAPGVRVIGCVAHIQRLHRRGDSLIMRLCAEIVTEIQYIPDLTCSEEGNFDDFEIVTPLEKKQLRWPKHWGRSCDEALPKYFKAWNLITPICLLSYAIPIRDFHNTYKYQISVLNYPFFQMIVQLMLEYCTQCIILHVLV